MEKTLKLTAKIRENTGSKAAAKERKQGRIPAIVYGHKMEPEAISLDEHDMVVGLHHGHRIMDLKIGKKTQKVLVKDLQYDYLGKNIIHADLVRVDITETIKVSVPIELKGTAKGTQEGGVITEHTDHLEIECQAANIPESIVVNVTDMDVGDTLHAADVELPEGASLASSPEILLVTCSLVAAAKAAEEIEEEEEPAAPEVITEAKKEEEGEPEQEKAKE
ncbi:MAG: 50S ribosomal protein L25 [Phycisphaerae bacterium]|nr:50S ribosomal protein L25 [Phycisphaerae bacterium]NIW70722.1 50S ribosomal protein L25 [candidate division KSB1 bacterium]NIP51257.1 50S ribosomal protein L25 [Phycisphaerae bacterium]NIS50460.1 50S ribosomal protein L25 [Phycisphaerae bacterium]NIU08200.1 50S ribosomal protein L25 [Phycisphaerae bacterium]